MKIKANVPNCPILKNGMPNNVIPGLQEVIFAVIEASSDASQDFKRPLPEGWKGYAADSSTYPNGKKRFPPIISMGIRKKRIIGLPQ